MASFTDARRPDATLQYIWQCGILTSEVTVVKKTTIYLEDEEYNSLRHKAFIENTSVAELIRRGAKLVCEPSSPQEQKAMKALEKIRTHVQKQGTQGKKIEQEVLNEQRAIRKKSK
jgi:hypothetical protein